MITRRLLLGAALAAPLSARANANAYPSKPIRVILPGPVGGIIDIGARAVSEAVHKALGQPLLIDPRPGGNGIMAAQMFLGAPADGYTLYLTVSGHVALPYLTKVPYDVIADFKPIAMIGVSSALLCVPADSPVRTLPEFVAYAKANSGKLNYLNPGNGTGAHLVPELMKIKYGIDVTSISYKGLPPGVQDLLGGRLDLALVSSPLVVQHVQAERLKALAVVGPKRLAELPGIPTMGELGIGDLEVLSSLPLYGQKDLPDALVERLNKAVNAALADADTQKHLASAYIQPLPMTSDDLGRTMTAEHERLGRLIRQLGIRADGA